MVCIFMYTNIHTYAYIHMCIHTDVCTDTHTHTHTVRILYILEAIQREYHLMCLMAQTVVAYAQYNSLGHLLTFISKTAKTQGKRSFSNFIQNIFHSHKCSVTTSVVQWSEFLATDTEVPGSIPGATRFSEQQWVWNGVHSAS